MLAPQCPTLPSQAPLTRRPPPSTPPQPRSFALAFGPSVENSAGIFGNPGTYGLMWNVGADPDPALAPTIPLLLFFLFQMVFAVITPVLIIGAVADRCARVCICACACMHVCLEEVRGHIMLGRLGGALAAGRPRCMPTGQRPPAQPWAGLDCAHAADLVLGSRAAPQVVRRPGRTPIRVARRAETAPNPHRDRPPPPPLHPPPAPAPHPRANIGALCIFVGLWHIVLYCPLAHMVW
jgi:hypothetical protein